MLLFSTFVSSTTMLILGDSLSAGYRMNIEYSWPSLLSEQLAKKKKNITVINASISGDTTGNALARLPALLAQHNPEAVFIELGANDGLRGFSSATISANLEKMILLIQSQKAQVILMQIEMPPNYGRRYANAFSEIYLTLSKKYSLPLIPFFLKEIFIINSQWIMKDGLHPTQQAQPWISQYVAEKIAPYLQ